ncbi:MAG: hypothetical protein IJT34_09330, partial [Butyrivibrio sp.]|nr:hypothetical protein [Butyrivibrio sp.]
MGFLDLFKRKPSWQKSCQNALEEIRSSSDPALILRIVHETHFEPQEEEAIALQASDRLWEIRNSSPGAKDMLERLALEVPSPIVRCHAACSLRGLESMKKQLSD